MGRDFKSKNKKEKMRFYSPLRYPGGKGKLVNYFKDLIKRNYSNKPIYIEPYVGGGSVALSLLIEGYADKIIWRIYISGCSSASIQPYPEYIHIC